MSPLDAPVAVVVLALAFLGFVVWFRQAWLRARRARRSSTRPGAPLGPVHDTPFNATCWVDRCDNPDPDTWVYSRNTGWLLVCHRCAHEGAAHGWWSIPDGVRGA